MQLDKNFVRSLNPSISDRLRHGDLQCLATEIGLTPLSVRNAVNGASTNSSVISAAIRLIAKDGKRTDEFLEQIPQEALELIFTKN